MSDTETIILKKPKKPRTQKQIDATAKLVAANKARREAKALEKSGGKATEPVPEPVSEPVKKKCCKNCNKGKPCEKKEETPNEEVIERKPRKQYTRKAPVPPPQEHYLESESEEEEEELEHIQELAPEPRSFRIPRHMRN